MVESGLRLERRYGSQYDYSGVVNTELHHCGYGFMYV